MAMYSAADANATLAANLGIGSAYTTVTGTHIRLGTTVGTATVAMTELTGSGYTTGGSSISWNAPSGQATSNSGAVSWTNGGSTWSIAGLEIWDVAGTPVRHYFGAWTGQPISVINGNVFQASAGAVAPSLV